MKICAIIWKDHTRDFWLSSVSQIFFFTCLDCSVIWFRFYLFFPTPIFNDSSNKVHLMKWSRKKDDQIMLHLKLTVQICFLEPGVRGWVGQGSFYSILVVMLEIIGQSSVCWLWLQANRSYCLWLLLFHFKRKQCFAVL